MSSVASGASDRGPVDCSYQVPLPMEFSQQEYWTELCFPAPGESSRSRDPTWVFCVSYILFSLSVLSNSLTPWTAAQQASLSITNSQSLMSIKSVMPSNHLILCHSRLFLPPILTFNSRISTCFFKKNFFVNILFYVWYSHTFSSSLNMLYFCFLNICGISKLYI